MTKKSYLDEIREAIQHMSPEDLQFVRDLIRRIKARRNAPKPTKRPAVKKTTKGGKK